MIHALGGVERRDNMAKKDYSKFSEKSKNNIQNVTEEDLKPIEEVVETDEVVEQNEILDAVDETIVDKVELDETNISGVVYNCNKLNVREQSIKNSKILCVVDKDTELIVDLTKSTEDFYKVTVCMNGEVIEGYCMKEYVQTFKDIKPVE